MRIFISVLIIVSTCLIDSFGETRNENDTESLNDNVLVNLFIENSGSMDGYVKGQTSFESDLYRTITKLKVNYNKVKTSVIFSTGSRDLVNESEIANFEPGMLPFRKPGEASGTAIDDIIKRVVNRTNSTSVSILVSDFIYSNNSISPITPSITITNILQSKLKVDKNFAILFVKQSSQYTGTYYSEKNHNNRQFINTSRPYYICFMGSDIQIKAIFALLYPEKPKEFIYLSNTPGKVSYQLLLTPKIGNYRLDKRSPKNSLIEAEAVVLKGKKSFQFSLGVDFSSLLLPESYLMDADNFQLSENYSINIIPKSKTATAKITHFILLQTSLLREEKVHIQLNRSLPLWVINSSSDDDSDITSARQVGKTYGFKYLMEGALAGYVNLINDPYCKIEISIKM